MLLHEQLASWHLLLASQSPRRRELMSGCGIPYELAPRYACEECYPDETLPTPAGVPVKSRSPMRRVTYFETWAMS